MSLRTRLILLTAFALVSVFAAAFVAWRLVKTTQTFTVFQTENELRSAARELAQEIRISPNGFEPEIAAPPKPKLPPVPPHVAGILREYSDSFTRLTAITLHSSSRVAGGFYRQADEKFFGYVSKDSSMPNQLEKFPQVAEIKAAINESTVERKSLTRKIAVGNDVYLLAVEPILSDAPASAAWTLERLPNFAQSDWANFAALGFLILATFGVSVFAFVTVRDLRRDTASIQMELAALELDLVRALPAPETKEFVGIVHAINDLSKRLRVNLEKQKQLETDLRRSEKLSALGRVASGVAHEIRNPLAAIKLKIQIAQRGALDEKLGETFRVVVEEIERLDRIVGRLLEFGKAQNLQFSTVNLNELLSRRAAFFADVAAQKNVVIENENSDANLIVRADEKRLTEVFDNLLRNALSAIGDAGEISIKTAAENKFVKIEISDTGAGINREERERIFEPFFTTRDDGTGLGLAISREIVEAHGGKIGFESERGRGTKFFVELPRNENEN